MSVIFSINIDPSQVQKARKKLAPKERVFRTDGLMRSAAPRTRIDTQDAFQEYLDEQEEIFANKE